MPTLISHCYEISSVENTYKFNNTKTYYVRLPGIIVLLEELIEIKQKYGTKIRY